MRHTVRVVIDGLGVTRRRKVQAECRLQRSRRRGTHARRRRAEARQSSRGRWGADQVGASDSQGPFESEIQRRLKPAKARTMSASCISAPATSSTYVMGGSDNMRTEGVGRERGQGKNRKVVGAFMQAVGSARAGRCDLVRFGCRQEMREQSGDSIHVKAVR